MRLDLNDARSIDDAFKCALAEAGYFDVVINNAGGGHFGPAEHLPVDEIEKQFQILLFGHLQDPDGCPRLRRERPLRGGLHSFGARAAGTVAGVSGDADVVPSEPQPAAMPAPKRTAAETASMR